MAADGMVTGEKPSTGIRAPSTLMKHPLLPIGDQMTTDQVINALDQLIADAKDVFGSNSDTFRNLKAAYKVAEKEADEITEHRGLSDQQEYAAAHAHQTFDNARAINSGR